MLFKQSALTRIHCITDSHSLYYGSIHSLSGKMGGGIIQASTRTLGFAQQYGLY